MLYGLCMAVTMLSEVAFATLTLDNVQALRELEQAEHGELVQLRHHSHESDEGGGLFRYDATSRVAGNGGTIIDPLYLAGRFMRASQGALDPKWFGAVGDGVNDDTEAIQAALNVMDSNPALTFTQGTYLVRESLELSRTGRQSSYRISGEGATLITDREISIFRRVPVDMTEAKRMASIRFYIDNLTFRGSKLSEQKGIELGASYGSCIRNCSFYNLGTAVDLMFALMGKIESCIATLCVKDAFVIRSGLGVFTSSHNAHSNHASIRHCRVYAAEGAYSSYKVLAANGVKVEGCIAEGRNPEYNLLFDNLGATTIKAFYISNFHSENQPSKAVIKLKSGGGIMDIEGLWMQHRFLTAIDMSGVLSAVKVENMPYLPYGTVFKNDGLHQWRFENCGFVVNDASVWHDGDVPPYLVADHFNTGGSNFPAISAAGKLVLEPKDELLLNAKKATKINSNFNLGLGGSTMLYVKKYRKNWDPESLAPGQYTSQVFDVEGISPNQHLNLGAYHNKIKGGVDVLLSVNTHGENKVKVVLFNPSENPVDITFGTLDISVMRFF